MSADSLTSAFKQLLTQSFCELAPKCLHGCESDAGISSRFLKIIKALVVCVASHTNRIISSKREALAKQKC